jgi:membrane protease YdiL (CAAX protease family)
MNSSGFRLTALMIAGVLFLQFLFLLQELGIIFIYSDSLVVTYIPIIFTTIMYLVLAVLIWMESANLQEFHIDRFTIFLFIFSSIIQIRSGIRGELVFVVLMVLSGISMFILLVLRKPPVHETNLSWTNRGIVAGLLVIVFLFIIEFLIRPPWTTMPLIGNSVLSTTIGLMATIFTAAPLEEMLFRGFLWGYLRRFGWTESKIFFVQGILFWLCHFSRLIVTPFVFFIGIPLMVFVTGKLVMKSKQLFPSILSHSIINMLSKGLNLASF